ncbi:hypothetical protein MMC09_003341 [Bachmanniomyces sp. S44760]|nr:hypothetical protein [Bachmanniomyces sp. S44760]
MASTTKSDPLVSLKATVANTLDILLTFTAGLQSFDPSLVTPPSDPLSPLALLCDASKVLRAHVTKLSLLAINKPFTPSEITFVLRSLSQECLPALVSAAELCRPKHYTQVLHRAIRERTISLLRELRILVNENPLEEQAWTEGGRDTLASTGVIWQRCDELTQLAEGGVVACALETIQGYQGLLKDAIEELEEWKEDEIQEGEQDMEDEEEDEYDTNQGEQDENSTLGMKTLNLNGGGKKRPEAERRESSHSEDDDDLGHQPWTQNDSTIKNLTIETIAFLRLLALLFPALQKRRVKRFPAITRITPNSDMPTSRQIENLDAIVVTCKFFSEETDELAGILYDHDARGVRNRIKSLGQRARDMLEMIKGTWDGGEDEFTVWVGQWLVKLDEMELDTRE